MDDDLDYDCFSCKGQNPACFGKRYTPYSDYQICLRRMIAKEDEARLRLGDFEGIRMKKEFAMHLMKIGQKDLSIKVLPKE